MSALMVILSFRCGSEWTCCTEVMGLVRWGCTLGPSHGGLSFSGILTRGWGCRESTWGGVHALAEWWRDLGWKIEGTRVVGDWVFGRHEPQGRRGFLRWGRGGKVMVGGCRGEFRGAVTTPFPVDSLGEGRYIGTQFSFFFSFLFRKVWARELNYREFWSDLMDVISCT